MEGKSIRIIGHSGSLKKSLENRISDRMIHEITNDLKSDITIFLDSRKTPPIKPPRNSIIIRPWKENIIPYNFNNCIELHIRDLLIVDPKGEWGPKDIFDWGNAIKSSINLNLSDYPVRFWTSKIDLINLIETLIDIEQIPKFVSIVCSRRPWTPADTFSELKMLWRRTSNVKQNKIDVIDLEIRKIPLGKSRIQPEQPNLKKLHEFLKPLNQVGWTPRTPLRISLMECLEKIDDIE
tara:strand:+ start:3118 stop:3828 length:711 start_codon:yes stop_codon:yes gene_type:complete